MSKIIVFTISLSILIHVGESGKSVCDTRNNGMIKFVLFDTTNKICCNQTISQRTTNLECCSGKYVYFSHESICCNGRVSKRWILEENGKPCEPEEPNCKERICCGNQLTFKQGSFCCGGKITVLYKNQASNRDFLECCGDKQFDRRSKICCGNSILQRNKAMGCCNGSEFDKEKFKCIHNRKMNLTERYCGNNVYNFMDDKCCSGHVVKGVPERVNYERGYEYNLDEKCCGTKVIKKDEQCCEERYYKFPTHVIPKGPNINCCGSGYINNRTQVCISGTAHSKPPNHVLCGNVLINASYQDCCANKLPYNTVDEECCQGASSCVIKKGKECCNGIGIKENEVCCENIKPCKKRFSDDDRCCYSFEREEGQTYATKNEACYFGQILNVPEEALPCGTTNYFLPHKSFCCHGHVYDIGNGQCCNGLHNDISEEEGRCCKLDGKVYRNDQENPCMKKCNKKNYYDLTNELCCHKRIFESTGDNECCGPYAINSQEMGCCDKKFPYDLKSKKKCCNNRQIYNEYHSHCTPDGKVEVKAFRGHTDVQKLCYKLSFKLFDGGFQHACLRDTAIIGKIHRVYTWLGEKGEVKINMRMIDVKTLRRKKLDFPKKMVQKKMTIVIHMTDVPHDCSFDYLKQMIHVKKIIVLFDSKHEQELGDVIEISQNSSFFLTPATFYRRYTVSKAVSEQACRMFS